MLRALHMEWTKLRTLPTTGWWLVGLLGMTVAFAAFAISGADAVNCASDCEFDLPRLSLSGVYVGQVAVVALAALAVSGEYDTMLIRVTLVAFPRRLTVLAAKLAVVTLVVLACACLAMLGSLAVGRGILPGNGFTPSHGYPLLSLADPATRRAYLGSVLYLGLIALLSAGIATIVRHTPAAVTIALGMLFITPIVSQFLRPHWRELVLKYSPMSAGLSIQVTKGVNTLPIAPWPGLAVLAAYAAAAVLAGAILLKSRDAG